jgi:mRNA-degrading endonuclease toxin of MazEF toxin-antitoxin module
VTQIHQGEVYWLDFGQLPERPKPSVVKVSQIPTIDKSELTEKIGQLPAATIHSIRTGLQLLFDRT